jgi:carbonic anhydrase/acetyltransferase-like protein (isoleucine patch superfamily)
MNATVLPRAVVGSEAVVAAGSVVGEGMEAPPRTLVAGVPARVKKELAGSSLAWVHMAAPDYYAKAREYRAAGIDRLAAGGAEE